MASGGPLFWESPFFTGPRVLMGQALGECFGSYSEESPGSGMVIDLLAGGSVYQRSPAHRRAPLSLLPAEIELSFKADLEDSFHAFERARAVGEYEPVTLWFARPMEDHWLVSGAETTYTLSRELGFGAVATGRFLPRAWLRDRQGATATEQTIITTGTPAAGEVKIDPAANSIVIETPDLSAEVGRLLVLRYYPIRLVRVTDLSLDSDAPNDMEYTVSLREVILPRSYA